MSDIVSTNAVLKKSADRSRPDILALSPDPNFLDWRNIPCAPLGTPKPEGYSAFWHYEELPGGKLRVTPSLHCLDTGFHTDGVWEVAYFICPDDTKAYDFFLLKNPSIALR